MGKVGEQSVKEAGKSEDMNIRMEKLHLRLIESEKRLEELEQQLSVKNELLKLQLEITTLLSQPTTSVEQVLDAASILLPKSIQHTKNTSISITYRKYQFNSPGYHEKNQLFHFPVTINGKEEGSIKISADLQHDFSGKNILHPDDKAVVKAISQRLINFIEIHENKIALQYSDNHYNTILNTLKDAVFEVTSEGILIFVTPAIEDIIGYTSEEILGKNILTMVHEEDRQWLSDRFKLLPSRGDTYSEFRFVDKNGKSRWVRTSTNPIIKDGKMIGGAGTISSIQTQKEIELKLIESNNKFRSIIEASPDIITITDLEGNIKLSSSSTTSLLELDPNESYIGESIFQLISNEDINRARESVKRILTGEIKGAEEYRLKTSSGGCIHVEVMAEVIKNQENIPEEILFITRDITERKRIHLELQESRLQYRDLVESINDAIYEVTMEGVLTYVSPSIYRIIGYTPEELIGKNFIDFLYPDDKNLLKKGLKTLGKNKYSYLEYRYVTKTNQDRWVRTSTNPIYKDGILIGGRGTLTDIHERKLEEQARIRSEEKFKTLFYDSPEAYLILEDQNFSEMNKAAEKLLGIKKEDLLGLHPLAISNDYQPNGKKSTDYAQEVLENCLKHGGCTFEWEHQREDKTRVLSRINLSMINYLGKEAILATMTDITELTRNEEQIRKLSTTLEQSPLSVIIVNRSGMIEYVNNTVCKITGYSEHELLGQKPSILKSGEIPEEVYSKLWQTISQGETWKGNLCNRKKNGELFWETSTISPITNKNGDITHYVALKEDITERLIIEKELEINQQRLNQIMSHSRTLVWEVNMDGLYTYLSDSSVEIYGYPPAEIVGNMHFYDLHPPEYRESFKISGLQHLREEREIKNFDNPILKKDGNTIWVSTNGQLIRDENGKAIGYRGSDTDITERKLAEQELRKFRTITDEANYGNVLTDLDGVFVYTNNAFAEMHGYRAEDLHGRHMSMLHSGTQIDRATDILEKLLLHGTLEAEEIWRTRKNGTVFPSLMNAIVLYDEQGNPQFLSATTIDISEIKDQDEKIREQNSRLKAVMEAMPDMIFTHDQAGNYLDFYKSEANFDLNDYSNLVGGNLRDAWPVETYNMLFGKIQECITTGKMITIEYPRIENGEKIWFEGRIVRMDDTKALRFVRNITERKEAQKKIQELNANLERKVKQRTMELAGANRELMEEIEERKKLEKELIAAKEEADAANRSKSIFLANMSHEIRTPMNAVLGYADILGSVITDKTQNDYIQSIKSSGKGLLTIINDVLDLSKIEAGKMELDFGYISTHSFFSDFEQIFALKLKQQGIEFILEITSGTPSGLYVDEVRLRQVILNLLGNAVKFTEDGHVRVSVRTDNPRLAKKEVTSTEEIIDLHIEVQDTGIGISEEDKSKIFDEFMQSGRKTSQGTGLGLAISRRLIQMMGGTITMESELGIGSTFNIFIPGIAFVRDLDTLQENTQFNPDEVVFSKSTLIVVDDVEVNRNYLKDALKNTEINVLEAQGGLEGLKLIEETMPDLIICDIRMPEMNGFEFIEHLKRIKKLRHIPVLAYSASVMKEQKQKIQDSEFAGLLIKPVLISELYKELCRFMPFETVKIASPAGISYGNISMENIIDRNDLMNSLENEAQAQWEKLQERQPINDVRKFGNLLITLGEKHEAQLCNKFGQDLIDAANNFNIDKILELIKKYPQLKLEINKTTQI